MLSKGFQASLRTTSPLICLDQTYTKNAADAFQKVIDKYPKSIYAEDSKKKRDFALSKIAEHELEIGKFYYDQDKYHAW